MGVEITTNHHRREVIDAWNLPPEVRAEFDYIDWPGVEDGTSSASFVRYRGQWFDLSDVPRIDRQQFPEGHPFRSWDGYVSDTYFSGTVFRYVYDDGEESVIVGSFFAVDHELCPNCGSANSRTTDGRSRERECQNCGTVWFETEENENA